MILNSRLFIWCSRKLILEILLTVDFKFVFTKWEDSTVDYYFQVNFQHCELHLPLLVLSLRHLIIWVNSLPYLYPLIFHKHCVASFCKRCFHLQWWLQNTWAQSTNSSTFTPISTCIWEINETMGLSPAWYTNVLYNAEIGANMKSMSAWLLVQKKAQWLKLKLFIWDYIARVWLGRFKCILKQQRKAG